MYFKKPINDLTRRNLIRNQNLGGEAPLSSGGISQKQLLIGNSVYELTPVGNVNSLPNQSLNPLSSPGIGLRKPTSIVQGTKVLVSNLHYDCNEQMLQKALSGVGPIISVEVIYDRFIYLLIC
jgi:RNA recognition motif-containing protein